MIRIAALALAKSRDSLTARLSGPPLAPGTSRAPAAALALLALMLTPFGSTITALDAESSARGFDPVGLRSGFGLSAQEIRTERRVPLAPGADIVEIPRSLRDRLGLFPAVEGFSVARLLQQDDGAIVLEVEATVGGELVRERRVLSDAELADLRESVVDRLAQSGGLAAMDRSGRGGFVLGHTLLGLGYHGWALPAILDLETSRSQVAAYLLTAGASFYVPYRLTSSRGVSGAQRDLSLYGGSRGILYGVLLGDVIGNRDRDGFDRVRLGGGLALSVAGSAAGYVAARDASQGSTALWGVMGDFGLMAGAGSAYAFGPYATREVEERDGDFVGITTVSRNRDLGHAITFAGGIGGLVAGRWMGGRSVYTEGNAGALRSAGILGAQLGISAGRAFTDEGRAIAGIGLVGGVAGIITGDRLVADRRLSSGEGLLVNAGHIAGAAGALGVTYLLTADVDGRELLYLSTSTVGSILGAGLVFGALGRGSDDSATGPGRRNKGPADGPGTSFALGGTAVTVHPTNLVLAASALLRGPGEAAEPTGRFVPSAPTVARSFAGSVLPLVTLSF